MAGGTERREKVQGVDGNVFGIPLHTLNIRFVFLSLLVYESVGRRDLFGGCIASQLGLDVQSEITYMFSFESSSTS